jgi:hypothetical protein
MSEQPSLFDDSDAPLPAPAEPSVESPAPAADPDGSARRFAVDPRNHVVLEASARVRRPFSSSDT